MVASCSRTYYRTMRKKINQTGFVIAGAAALFVGLAGNMQATPISIHDNWEAGMRSWILGRDLQGNEWILGQNLHGNEIAHFIDQSSHNQISTSPNAFPSGPASAQNGDVHGNPGLPGLSQGSQGAPPLTILPLIHGPASVNDGVPPLAVVPISNSPALVSIPDGGATALMLAGVFCGFVFLRKNPKPAQVA